jgi:hypothetical protein
MTESLSATRSEKATGIFQCNRTEYDDGSPFLISIILLSRRVSRLKQLERPSIFIGVALWQRA